MPFYNRIVQSSIFLIAWWLMAMHGYAAIPHDPSRIILLIIASAALIYRGYTMHKAGNRISAMLTFFYACACYLFYIEALWLLTPDGPMWANAVIIYNILRFVLMFLTFIILIRDWIKSIRME